MRLRPDPASPDEAAILTMLAGVWRGIERAEMGDLRFESVEYGFDRVLRDLPLHNAKYDDRRSPTAGISQIGLDASLFA